jgi:hypothetical protein
MTSLSQHFVVGIRKKHRPPFGQNHAVIASAAISEHIEAP